MEGNQARPDQLQDLALLMNNRRFMLLSDPGSGKTIPVCLLMWWLWSEHKERSVWVMPSTIKQKNKDELLKWSEFEPADVMIYEGNGIKGDPKILIMTFDRWKLSWTSLIKRFPDINCIVADEWHLGYKTFTSKRCSEMRKALTHIERLVPMSGSLIAGRLDSAYPVIDMIEPRYYSGPENFKYTHGILDEYGNVISWINHDRLGKILRNHCTSRSFAEIFGQQEIVIQVEDIDMAPLQREKYDMFERDAVLELEDRWLDGTLPGVNTIRCLQIMEHPECIKLPTAHDEKGNPTELKEYNLVQGKPTGKDERLQLHLEDHLNTGTRLAIFGTFHTEIERIARLCQKLGLRTGLIHGGIPAAVRAKIDADFNAHRIDVVVGTSATAGIGLNWPFLNQVIFSSLDFQDDRFFQAYMRAIRGKRKTPLLISVLAYKKSLDQRKMYIVEKKSRDAHKANPQQQIIDFHL